MKMTTNSGLNFHIMPQTNQYDSVLIWLHGEGDKAESFVELFRPTKFEKGVNKKGSLMGNAKIVLPTSKKRFCFVKD